MTPAERRRARARASVCRLFEARRRAEPSPPWRLPSLGRGPTPARLRRGERPSSLDLELLEAAPSAWGLALLRRLPTEVEVLWRFGALHLDLVLGERVRRPRGFVPTATRWTNVRRLGEAGLPDDRPGARLLVLDVFVFEPGGLRRDGPIRVGRATLPRTAFRAAVGALELGFRVDADVGAWLWLGRARQAEEIVPRGYEVWQSEGWLR